MYPLLLAARRGATRAFTSAPASAAAAAGLEDKLISSTDPVAFTSEALAVRDLAGRGRGVVAQQAIIAGQLLLAAPPLVVQHGAVEEQPDAALLAAQLCTSHWSPAALVALGQQYDGTASSMAQRPALRELVAACYSRPDADESKQSVAPEWAAQIIKFNAFGDDYEDLAAAQLRGAQPASHVGLWPAFSMFNHSCAPNTVHYVVGSTMVVRAVEDVAEGQELCVSYMGREEFAPPGARQAVLAERYGFDCDCCRCKAELAAVGKLVDLVNNIYITVQRDLKPAFMAAAEALDTAALRPLAAELRQLAGRLDGALRAQQDLGALDHPVAQYLHACVYDLHECLYFAHRIDAAEASGGAGEAAQAALALLSVQLAAVDATCRGSEIHVFLASQLLRRAAGLRGADSGAAEAAAGLVEMAHVSRYGVQLARDTMLALMDANRRISEDFL